MPRRRGLLRTAARTAVVAGTATSVAGRVAHRQQRKFGAQAPPTTVLKAPEQVHAATGHDIVEDLQRLADLKASGALSDKEYAAAKSRVLAS